MTKTLHPLAKPPQLIIAEDDLDDQFLLQDALKDNGIDAKNVTFVEDGDELLTALHGLEQKPTIILLDLNMPKKDGRAALQEIKASTNLRHIPVIVFTTSSSEEDIKLTYQHGGNSFFTKPVLYEELVDIVALIKKYWFESALLAFQPNT